MTQLTIGRTAERHLTVGERDTAVQWGSGNVRVLSTPHLIALMEGAAVDAVDPDLPAGQQTVGTRVDIEHLAATPVGGRVTARATLVSVDGRRLRFEVLAEDGAGLIGRGTHERVIVDVARFMARALARITSRPEER